MLNHSRPRIIGLRIALAAALSMILFLATTPRQYPVVGDINDKCNHIMAFFVLALLADGSFPEKNFFPAKFLPLLGYGMGIEFIQLFLPFREFSLFDIGADVAGMGIYLILLPVLKKWMGTVLK